MCYTRDFHHLDFVEIPHYETWYHRERQTKKMQSIIIDCDAKENSRT